MPESMHMIMWAMSDRTIPRSLRMIEGFGVHTFRLVNAAGEGDVREVPLEAGAGPAVHLWDEAVKIAGADPDFHRRDLFEAIDGGRLPRRGIFASRCSTRPGGGSPMTCSTRPS
jgi:catalase